MFASVYLVTDTHENAIVMPKRAISVESLSDTVFVVKDGQAERRDVDARLRRDGSRRGARRALGVGERVIVVGQDGLTNGTPVQVLKGPGAEKAPVRRADARTSSVPREDLPEAESASTSPKLTPEQLERIKARMKDRGMSDAEIEQALARRRRSPQ